MRFIAYREDTWLDEITDRAQWKQLIKAFGYKNTDLKLITEWDDLLIEGLPVVIFDQVGTISLKDFVHPIDCCYVFGHTGFNDLPKIINHDYSVVIPTVASVSLFGVDACAIALWDRYLKT